MLCISYITQASEEIERGQLTSQMRKLGFEPKKSKQSHQVLQREPNFTVSEFQENEISIGTCPPTTMPCITVRCNTG